MGDLRRGVGRRECWQPLANNGLCRTRSKRIGDAVFGSYTSRIRMYGAVVLHLTIRAIDFI